VLFCGPVNISTLKSIGLGHYISSKLLPFFICKGSELTFLDTENLC